MTWQLNGDERRKAIRRALHEWLLDPEHMGDEDSLAFQAAAKVKPSWSHCDEDDSEAAADAIHALVRDEKRRLLVFLDGRCATPGCDGFASDHCDMCR